MRMVTIADLKNNLSKYLRDVRQGESLTVVSRDLPVARLVPVEKGPQPLRTRPPATGAPKLRDVHLPPPLPLETDIVALLLLEREER